MCVVCVCVCVKSVYSCVCCHSIHSGRQSLHIHRGLYITHGAPTTTAGCLFSQVSEQETLYMYIYIYYLVVYWLLLK